MSDQTRFVFSYPFSVTKLPKSGAHIEITASRQDCLALAEDFKIPKINEIKADLTISGNTEKVSVKGEVYAAVTLQCGVSLEYFDSCVKEPVEVEFISEKQAARGDIVENAEDEADYIINGSIDLGQIVSEFFALGLEPFPRKPGVEFTYCEDGLTDKSPFSELKSLISE